METTTVGLPIDAERTVNEVIRTHPATVEVFNRFGVDACCGGASTIEEAAYRDRVSPDELLAALNQAAGTAR